MEASSVGAIQRPLLFMLHTLHEIQQIGALNDHNLRSDPRHPTANLVAWCDRYDLIGVRPTRVRW